MASRREHRGSPDQRTEPRTQRPAERRARAQPSRVARRAARSSCRTGGPSPRPSSPTSARPTPARPTRRSSSSPRRARRLRRAAADARPGGAPASARAARGGAGRPRHRRGADQRARADHLLHRRDGAAPPGTCSCSTRCSGPTTGARLRLDAAAARRRVQAHPPARRRRGAAARPERVPRGRDQVLRAQAAARLDGRRLLPEPQARHRRRRLQPPRRARARRGAQPAAARPRRRPLRRDAARVAPARDRPLPQRRRPTSAAPPTCSGTASTSPARRSSSRRRRSSTARSGATCTPWEIAQIAGRAGRFGLVERGHVGVLTGIVWANADPELIESALTPHVPLPGGTWATASSTRRASGRGSRICRSRSPHQLAAALRAWHTARDAPVGDRRLALRRVDRRRCSSGSTRCSAGSTSGAAASRSSRPGSSSTRRWTRTTPSCSATLALAVAGDRAQRPVLQWLLDTNRLRDASLEDAEHAARTASILRWFALQYPDVGGVTIERAAALEEAAAAERVSAKLAAEVSSPSVGRCKSCGRAARPGSRSASAATAAGSGARRPSSRRSRLSRSRSAAS